MKALLPRLRVAFRIAVRELRGGLRGFYIFLACIALGTGAIAAVNSVSTAITDAIASQGRELLAGDARFELNNREATPEERRFLNDLGTIAVSTVLRSMARLPDGSDQSLVEVKAVDQLYPLYGTFAADPPQSLPDAFAKKDGAFGALAAPLLLERLGLAAGDELLVGKARFHISGIIANEPDAISDGMGFAPRLLTSLDGLKASGLVETGSLVEHAYKVRLHEPHLSPADLREKAQATLPNAGWSIRTSDRAAPALSENIARFSQFLTLVGLTALIVGGVGVANAVRAFLDSKRVVIATLKCLGAPATVVALVYFIQIAIIAAVGIAGGIIVGVVAPIVAAQYLGQVLPIPVAPALYPGALVLASLFGMLVTLAFSILPLGHVREIPATALFREQGLEAGGWPSRTYILAAAFLFVALAALAISVSDDRRIATLFLVSIAVGFVVLRFVALLIAMAARRVPRPASAALRLAIGNIYRPGALTPSVVLSLGLGLTLLVALALVDGNLRRELTSSLPERAPNFFFVDIQKTELDGFRRLLIARSPAGRVEEVPMLRGRILAFNGTDVTKMEVPPAGRWVLRGDRGITYSEALPGNAQVTAGKWWPAGYTGEPLVSFSAEEAAQLGLKIGDKVTVNVLGRSITARIANFRKVDWESLSINFVMIFSPNTFAGAPHTWLATLTLPDATSAEEAAILRAVTRSYPTITSVRVKDALDVVERLVGQLATAIRAAAGIALVTSVLVLSGALAAGNRARTHDAVILKTLGATRGLLIRAFTYEYLLLGATTAAFALAGGGAAAWYVTARIMNLPSSFLPTVALTTLALSLLITVGVGLAGTWRILGQKAAPVLREL